MSIVKMHHTLDRRRGLTTPSEADFICPFFKERFFEWGAVDKVACCEKTTDAIECHYKRTEDDGTPICLRYDYRNKDIVENADPTPNLPSIPYIEENPDKQIWFSKDYDDTHQKVWGIHGRQLGWHNEV